MTGSVLAHGGFATPETLWHVDPVAFVVMGAGVAVVAAAARHGAARAGSAPAVRKARAGWCAGAVVLVLAVASPLHGLADALFAAHMVQHLLLVTVAAPLLVRGLPAVTGRDRPTDRLPLWSLPLATLALVVVFTAWHAPVLYVAAVEHSTLHAVEHATMLVAALAYWAAIAAATARGHDLAAVGAVAVSGLAGLALGALLALAPEPWFDVHRAGAAAWDVDPLADQQLGGMIMWVPGGAANLAAAVVLAFRLVSRHDDDGADLRPVPPAPAR